MWSYMIALGNNSSVDPFASVKKYGVFGVFVKSF